MFNVNTGKFDLMSSWNDMNDMKMCLTFSMDIDLLIYESHNLLWRDVIAPCDVLNSLQRVDTVQLIIGYVKHSKFSFLCNTTHWFVRV